MAINFPDSPTNAQTYADPGTGQTWTYELATNSWTASSLATTGGVVYKGSVDITAAPPTGAKAGEQWSIGTGGTANAGYGPGITGAVTKGSMVMYTGTAWLETSHAVPDATTAAKGIDTQKWSRAGTVLSPATAGDQVHTGTGSLTAGGAAAAPNIEIKADGGIVANTDGLVYDAATKRLALGSSNPLATNHIRGSGTSGQVTASWLLENASSGTVGMDVTGAPGSSIWRFLYGGGPSTGTNALTPAITIGVEGSAAGRVGIGDNVPGSTLTVKGATGVTPLQISGPSSEFCRVDSSGRLLVGTSSSPSAGLGQYARISAVGYTGSATAEGIMTIARGKAATAMVSGDTVGQLAFTDINGNDFAKIVCSADATPGSNDYPGVLTFSTTADGASSPAERMRIKASGVVNIAATTVYADNTAAKAGGLVAGDIYRKADGTLMITF